MSKTLFNEILKRFQKSTGAAAAPATPADPVAGEAELLEEAFRALDTGEIQDDRMEIASWSRKKGLQGGGKTAGQFADRVLFEYYGGAETPVHAPAAENPEMAKSLTALQEDLALFGEGLAQVIGILEPLDKIAARIDAIEAGSKTGAETINTLKSQLEAIAKQPADAPKTPDLHAAPTGPAPAPYPYELTLNRIMKGVSERILHADDVRSWEVDEVLTDRAREYVDAQRQAAGK